MWNWPRTWRSATCITGACWPPASCPFRSWEVTVEAASDEPDDQAAADLVRAALDAADVEELLFDLQDGLGKGYSVVEMIWDTSRAPWRVVGFEHRDPRWFQFDRTTGAPCGWWTGRRWRPPWSPTASSSTHRRRRAACPSARSGAGGGVGLPVQNFAIKDWVVFAEVYGHPLRLGKYGPGASEPDKDICWTRCATSAPTPPRSSPSPC
ncbi:DUF935 family protein (plasmid) [Azospirillum argentinense]|uniref:DUF935 family protein n=1 Tax=Azospirillum argentinense TaxID=2970906 RepID=A0A4D8PRS5_9PROT|nr:DUF935 family protein [Azospirillum argentinense]